MGPISRVVMAAFAAFVVWTLVRAGRRGVIYSGGWSFDSNERPMLFALCYLVHVLLVAMFLGLAAGYTPAEEKQFAWMLLNMGR
jgi:hypothetical protein